MFRALGETWTKSLHDCYWCEGACMELVVRVQQSDCLGITTSLISFSIRGLKCSNDNELKFYTILIPCLFMFIGARMALFPLAVFWFTVSARIVTVDGSCK